MSNDRFTPAGARAVLTLAQIESRAIAELLTRFGLELLEVAPGHDIPGSYWGDEEAGLVGNHLLARPDTPVHSLLHETCHFICMDSERRQGLHTNAGGGYDEENAVCYLQVLLSDHVPGMGRQRMMSDMDQWGYSFRLGSTQAWFERDADDARDWLTGEGLIDSSQHPTWAIRNDHR